MLRLVGSDDERRLYLILAADLDAGVAELRGVPFAALITLDARQRSDEDLRAIARTLIDAGCAYTVCWGPQEGRMDLMVDWEYINRPGDHFVSTTTYSEGDPLLEALWSALALTGFTEDNIELPLVAVTDEVWQEEIESRLSDTTRLWEDYMAFDDARIAAEEAARPRGLVARLRKRWRVGRT